MWPAPARATLFKENHAIRLRIEEASIVRDQPGTYVYHSHFNSTEQVGKGLYGALIVEPKNGDWASVYGVNPDVDPLTQLEKLGMTREGTRFAHDRAGGKPGRLAGGDAGAGVANGHGHAALLDELLQLRRCRGLVGRAPALPRRSAAGSR